MTELQSSRAVLAALKGLQDKVRRLENDRRQAVEDAEALRRELTQRQEHFRHSQELQKLTTQEESAASRLAYERLLADKRVVDIRLDDTERLKQELQETCETARNRGQDAHVAQLAAEVKASILEGRVKQCEKAVQSRKGRCSRASKTACRDKAMADSQLLKLTRRVKRLQCTLKGESASRKSAETRHRRAQGVTIQTSRYLDSILSVNQELVKTTIGNTSPPDPPTRHTASARGIATPSGLQRKPSNDRVPRVWTKVEGNGVDVGTAVAHACTVGRAGGDAVPYLTALYERIGFCAMQDENGNDGGAQSLPTSPSRASARHALDQHVLQGVGDRKARSMHPNLANGAGGFFHEENGARVLGSQRRRGSDRTTISSKTDPRPSDGGRHHGTDNDAVGGEATKAYSFASSPKVHVRTTSIAEKTPQILNRLEDLASQLEEERGNAEKRYKDVVTRASPGAQAEGTNADLDARNLCNAIACLQEKARQLEVVRESLSAMKASPRTPPVSSPIVCRRKVAALHVLQGLCHDVVAGEMNGPHAA